MSELETRVAGHYTTGSLLERIRAGLASMGVDPDRPSAGDLKPVANQQFDPSDFPRGHEVLTEDGVEYDVYNFRTIAAGSASTGAPSSPGCAAGGPLAARGGSARTRPTRSR